jgi:hypothetical protein
MLNPRYLIVFSDIMHISDTVVDIILLRVLYLKHGVSKAGISVRLQVIPIRLGYKQLKQTNSVALGP